MQIRQSSRVEVVLLKTLSLSLSCSLCLNAYRLYTAYLPAATAYQQWQIVVNKNVAAACTHAQWDELVSVSVTYKEIVASLARPLRFTYLCSKSSMFDWRLLRSLRDVIVDLGPRWMFLFSRLCVEFASLAFAFAFASSCGKLCKVVT